MNYLHRLSFLPNFRADSLDSIAAARSFSVLVFKVRDDDESLPYSIEICL